MTSSDSILFTWEEEYIMGIAGAFLMFEIHGDMEGLKELQMKQLPYIMNHIEDLRSAIGKVREKCVLKQ